MKKALAVLVLLGVLGLLGWQIYRKATGSAEKSGRTARLAVVAVEVAPVRRATVRHIEQFMGTLRPRSQFVVAPKVGGRLEKLLVDVGDPVRGDKLIAVLDDEEYAQQVEEARAELEAAKAGAEEIRLVAALQDEEHAQAVAQAQAALGSAKANVEECRSTLANTQREFQRAKALYARKVVSFAELDTAEARYNTAKARLEVALAKVVEKRATLTAAQVRLSQTQKNARAAEHKVALGKVAQKKAALKAAQVRSSYTQIKAPAWKDGQLARVVGERFVDEGAMLKANDPIVSVLEISALKAVVHVTERDYPKVRAGQGVTLRTDAFPGRSFAGKIARVAPLLKEASRQASVEIEVPNPERLLKPGMFIRAQVELDRHEAATAVPLTALVRRNGQQGVFVADIEGLKAHFVPITPGITEGELTEIVNPPSSVQNAWVVTLGHHLLEDGSAITLPDGTPQTLKRAGTGSQR